jgi:hypothetical protein
MNSSLPCTDYLPSTIAISPRKQCSTSCNSITPILRTGLRMRPLRYRSVRRSWNAFMNANTVRKMFWIFYAAPYQLTTPAGRTAISGPLTKVSLAVDIGRPQLSFTFLHRGPLWSALRTQFRHRAKSEKCQYRKSWGTLTQNCGISTSTSGHNDD